MSNEARNRTVRMLSTLHKAGNRFQHRETRRLKMVIQQGRRE
ncbi:MAG: hypothetical protein OJF47_002392 [Nitrospira sp.]|nr:MAG: hypothetical protein OJF47_002392 [Nitrospira sp.]